MDFEIILDIAEKAHSKVCRMGRTYCDKCKAIENGKQKLKDAEEQESYVTLYIP
jgi:hypothetical protein